MTTNPALLLLADGRLPAGGHVHSGGVEAAIEAGLVSDADDLAGWCRSRLRSIGRVDAVVTVVGWDEASRHPDERRGWDLLARELDARTPVAALRAVSRARGRGLLRVADATWGRIDLPDDARRAGFPLPLVLGAVAAATGCTAADAALVSATSTATEPAQAALRLLGLDPLAITRLTAELATDLAELAAEAVELAARPPADWPAVATPNHDLLAAAHAEHDARLFAS